MKSIYLDHNSTTPTSPSVIEAMVRCYEEGFLNPASQHRPGQKARQRLEKLRSEVIDMLGGTSTGMQTDRLIITSGGTESNNLAISGLAHTVRKTRPVVAGPNSSNPSETSNAPNSPTQNTHRIVISSIEHPSVIGVAQYLSTLGFELDTVRVDSNGVCNLDHLTELLDEPSRLPVAVVSIMAANNETGVIQPIEKAAEICRSRSVLFHTDAVQMVGKLPVDFSQLKLDCLSFTAHKFHGPRGIGALLVKHGVQLTPMLYGGFQQTGLRPGTENVVLATGMHQALAEFVQSPLRATQTTFLRERLESGLLSIVPQAVINGVNGPRMPHTTNISFPGINRQAFLMAADFAGLAISTGSACASGSSDSSHVIIAMGAAEDVVEGSIRISIGATTTRHEIDQSLTRFKQIIDRISTT